MQDDRKDDNDFGDMIHKPNGHHRTGFTGINIGGGNVNILAIVLTIVTIIAVIWCICNFQALSIIIAAVVAAIIIKLQRFFLIVAVILVILIIIWWSSGRGGRRYRRW